MKIYSMTATFGKFNHETLTLKPGLNVISAPNEWGKSTWCAFLINMLYGIDTRQRGNLPDKTHYAPWSGAPMSGRIELNWNGRDITIERSSTVRVPFGNFRAYETETGMDIPELDGTNCGKMLLGVERSVFTRAGFIRHTDMPVSEDDALRRRLNDLVTTGDESGDGDRLEETLKNLKNKCRFNNIGLLPQAETERKQLRDQLDLIIDLQNTAQELKDQQTAVTERIDTLSNHETTLLYKAAKEDAARVEQAREVADRYQQEAAALQQTLELLPDPAQAQPALEAGNRLAKDLEELELEKRLLPPVPIAPQAPAHFAGITPQQAVTMTQVHVQRHQELTEKIRKKSSLLTLWYIPMALGMLSLLAGAILKSMILIFGGLLVAMLSASFTLLTIRQRGTLRKAQQELEAAHPGLTPETWLNDALAYVSQHNSYSQQVTDYNRRIEDLNRRQQLLYKQVETFTGGGTLQQQLDRWNEALNCKNRLDDTQQRLQTAQAHLQVLTAMARPVKPPACPDQLELPLEETRSQLHSARTELTKLQQQLHQCRGRIDALGQEAVTRARLDATLRRIERLEDTYHALELAQQALAQATQTLQQRFAPRIAKRAQALFSQLTDGRYDRLTLSRDFTLNVSAQNEDTLHSAQWRSDGTMDQLYLALRLAVAEALTPDAPLVLDDALLRFDNSRLMYAMELLKTVAEEKQIILFSCHDRESNLI